MALLLDNDIFIIFYLLITHHFNNS